MIWHHPGRLKILDCRRKFSNYGCEANVWIKTRKGGDNINIFNPGYHLSNVKNVVITPKKKKSGLHYKYKSLVLFRKIVVA